MSAVIDWRIDDTASMRSLTVDDADEMFALVEANRARLEPWMGWAPQTKSADDVRRFIERARASEHDVEANGLMVDGAIAGAMGMSVDRLEDKGEIGYWIDERFEGRGLITSGARLFLDHGFGEFGLHRISIHAAVGNHRSRAVPERLGFTQEGVFRGACKTAAGYLDLVVYAMLAAEWRDAAGRPGSS
jgi:ribosomal-protein-serine acetyltransferase